MVRWWGVQGFCLFILMGCGAVTVDDYVNEQPALVPEMFFDGRLTAHGVIKNRRGRVIRHFNAEIEACWEGDSGVLDEWFEFNDGERQQRVWTLTRVADGHYVGRAGDVVGPAEIRVAGNAMFLDYVLRIPYRGSSLDLRIDDRMYRVSRDVVINESVMRKWGVRVGAIQLVLERREGETSFSASDVACPVPQAG